MYSQYWYYGYFFLVKSFTRMYTKLAGKIMKSNTERKIVSIVPPIVRVPVIFLLQNMFAFAFEQYS